MSFFISKWPLNLIELQFLQATDLLLCQFPSSSAIGNNISSGTVKKIRKHFQLQKFIDNFSGKINIHLPHMSCAVWLVVDDVDDKG